MKRKETRKIKNKKINKERREKGGKNEVEYSGRVKQRGSVVVNIIVNIILCIYCTTHAMVPDSWQLLSCIAVLHANGF